MNTKKLALLTVLLILLPSLLSVQATATPPPINDVLKEVKGRPDMVGNGSLAGMDVYGVEAGVIYGDSRDRGPPILYVKAPRLLSICENRDGNRVTGRSTVSEDEYFYISLCRLIEFRDSNNNSFFDGTSSGYDYHLLGPDMPVGGLSMNLSWSGRHSITTQSDSLATFNAMLFCRDPHANLRWNDFSGRMEPYSGPKIADDISLNVKIDMSYSDAKKDVGSSLCAEDASGSTQAGGTELNLKVSMNYTVDGWAYRYDDSRLMVETIAGVYHGNISDRDFLVNITTSSPRYLNITDSTKIITPYPVYGRSQRIYANDDMLGEVKGNRIAVSNGENETYRMEMMGVGKGVPEPEGMRGFSTVCGSTYGQANISTSGISLETSYFIFSGFERTDATPGWMIYALLAESSFIAVGAVLSSYRKYRR